MLDAQAGAGGAQTILDPFAIQGFCDPDPFEAAGGALGTGGAGSEPDVVPVDDFEDGNRWSKPVLGGLGWWGMNPGGASYAYPEPCPAPTELVGELPGSSWSMLTVRCSFGFFPSILFLHLRRGAPDNCDTPIDASQYQGVSFKARGTTLFRVEIATVALSDAIDVGTCVDGCGDYHGVTIVPNTFWTSYEVPFSAMTQQGFGTSAEFDPATILELRWVLGLSPDVVELVIDDVAFFRK